MGKGERMATHSGWHSYNTQNPAQWRGIFCIVAGEYRGAMPLCAGEFEGAAALLKASDLWNERSEV